MSGLDPLPSCKPLPFFQLLLHFLSVAIHSFRQQLLLIALVYMFSKKAYMYHVDLPFFPQ